MVTNPAYEPQEEVLALRADEIKDEDDSHLEIGYWLNLV